MEIYTLTISFPFDDSEVPWFRTIEVREDFMLYELHRYIQEIIDFNNDHLYEFYIGRNPRKRMEVISQDTKLNDLYPLTGVKLYYLFDFGDSWIFQLKKSRKKKSEEEGVTYPVLLESSGENPQQYPDYDFDD